MALRLLLLSLMLTFAGVCSAQDDLYQFDTENQRENYVTLTTELRCPKCQNQNLADSNSEISDIMRDVIAEELLAGSTEDEIKTLMVDRYGDFVLYKPPVNKATIALWWAPFVFMAVVVLALIFVVAKRSKLASEEFEDEQDELKSQEAELEDANGEATDNSDGEDKS